ncbi:MAG: hypothetical protein ABI143_10635, partial [Caldimonas sp.]
MNTLNAPSKVKRRSGLGSALLAGALLVHTMPVAALTDLSSTPLQGSSAAQVKPNIMLLMDASRSTGWGHMPDEVESITGAGSVGYKNSSCNVLYYNPSQRYTLPKRADGTFFTLPSSVTNYSTATFNAAPYTGYLQYYTAPDATDSSNVDLGTSFKAYDGKTLYVTYQNDTPQPAYYYAHSNNAQPLNYANPPCTDSDT